MTRCAILLTVSLAALVSAGGKPSAPPDGAMAKMLDVMSEWATGKPYDRTFLDEMVECWGTVDPGLLATQNRVWEGFLNFSQSNGDPSDAWTPNLGCDVPGKEDRQPYMERNQSTIGGAPVGGKFLKICEPCNFNSNLAFYRTTTRICAREKASPWQVSSDMKVAIMQAVAGEASGSAFMHGSQTQLGNDLDTRGEFVVPLLSHQMAIQNLPEEWRDSSVLNSFSLNSSVLTGMELIALQVHTFNTVPVDGWHAVFNQLDGDVSKPIASIIGSLLTLLFPENVVNAACALIIKLLKHAPMDPHLLQFLTEHYLPTYRNATAHIHLGPLKKLELLRTGLGSFVRFLYAIFWQEQILPIKLFLTPFMNKIGAELMPHVYGLADWLTGFMNTDVPEKTCSPDVYPGAGWCRPEIPHAKWHEIDAGAFYDLLSFGEYLGKIYAQAEATRGQTGFSVPEPEEDSVGQAQAVQAILDGVGVFIEHANAVVSDVLVVAEKEEAGPYAFFASTVPDTAMLHQMFSWRVLAVLSTTLLFFSVVACFSLLREVRKLRAAAVSNSLDTKLSVYLTPQV